MNTVSTLLEGARDDSERARLLAVMDKDSGAWLQVLPITSVGLQMDNTTLQSAIGLRLGTPICAHLCQHCGEKVISLGYHVSTARGTIQGTWPLMILFTMPLFWLEYHPGWSLQASLGQMARGQMA